MNIVITMAGLGERFLKAGYKQPKYEIEVHGKTLFEWSLLSLAELNKYQDVRYFFVVRKGLDAPNFVRESCERLSIKDYRIMEIDEVTDGQASTAMLAQEFWDASEELVIYNIDTFIEPGVIKRSDFVGDGFIPCFDGEGDHWSFVKLDKGGKATMVKEKERISSHCSIGLYYFKDCSVFTRAYHGYYDEMRVGKYCGEKYIAPIYNWLIANGFVIRINSLPKAKVHCLGTPEELEAFEKCRI